MLLGIHGSFVRSTALVCTALLMPGDVLLMAQQASPPSAEAPAEAPAKLPAEQLESLIAPIALYPDELLAQVLAASTYPLEIVQLQQWLAQHKDLKDKKLAEAVQKQNWDPSIQGLAGLPDVVKQLADNIQWTSELGNAFLAQQSDVMDAVQRMRGKAKDSGKLQSGEQIKVETKVVESKNIVVIEQANPEVVYVPSYNPTVVWGAPPPAYAYPPVAYPPPGYYAAGMALSFGVGMAMGAMWGGGWGYNCGWGGNNTVNINNNNNFNRNSNRVSGGNQVGGGNRVGGGNSWQHNPQHRGGAPYGDRATAKQFGGSARGEGRGTRQASANQGLAQRGGGGTRGGAGAGASGFRSGGGAGAGGGLSGSRSGGGGDRVGNRQVSSGGGSRGGAFGGGGGGGSSARASSSRGSSSMGGSRGGGGGGRRR